MPDYITPADVSAFNAAAQAAEGYNAAKRGGLGQIQRNVAACPAAGIADWEIFKSMAEGAPERSGLRYLCLLLSKLTEYLGSWGTLVLLAVSFVSTLVMLKQNAKHIWTTITTFVTKHPLITAAIAGGIGAGAGYMLKDDVDDAVDGLTEVALSALPGPIAFLARKVSSSLTPSAYTNGRSPTGTDAAGNAGGSETWNEATGQYEYGSTMSKLTGQDAYTRDAYTRDAYTRDAQPRMHRDTFSGNIGV